jgi:hypothetical protein
MVPMVPPGENEIEFSCPQCGQNLSVPATSAGKLCNCNSCRKWVLVPGTPVNESIREGRPSYPQYGEQPGQGDPYALSDREREEYELLKAQQQAQQGDGGNQLKGWIIFILIFGVGNIILYATTGIFLIPIRR